jgi:hypothetical protein
LKRVILPFLFILLFLITAAGQAQNSSSINGYITDSETGETLISANIALLEINRGTSTNTSGYYSITNITPGTYTLVASYIGYRQFEQEVELIGGETERIDIEMIPAGLELETVVVESQAEREEQRNIGTTQISTELIKNLPPVIEPDVFRSVQLLPGVKAANDFSSGLYVRGGSPDQTLILLDETTVYNPSHFFGFFSTFNPDAVKDVRLYKGGYPASYGGRLGSVLTVFNKDGNRNETQGSVSLGLLASRISAEGPTGSGSWMLAFRRSTLEPVLAVLRGTTDNVPDSFYFYDINGKLNFDATNNDRLSLAFYTGTDKVLFPFGEDASIGLNYGNRTVSAQWRKILSDKLFLKTTATGSRYFNNPEFSIGGTQFERDNNVYDISLKSDLQYTPNENHTISTGFWAGNLILRFNDSFDNQETSANRIESRYASFYLQDEWKPTNQWIFNGGVRVNRFSEGDYLRFAPRLSAEYRPNSAIRLQAAYGRYYQFLTLITNEAFSGFDLWLTTSEGVPPAYGDQFVLGAKTIPFEGYGFDIEFYYRTMRDLFELDPFTGDAAGLDYQDLFRFGDGFAYGAELFFEKQVGRLTGFAGYTFGITRRKYPGFNTDITISNPEARFYPPKYDRLHDANIVLNYRLSERWSTSAVFSYGTGQAYTEPLGRTEFPGVPWGNMDRESFTIGRLNASRLPSYHRMDVAFSRAGNFFGLGEAEWRFQIINIYSRRNTWFYNYDFDENPVERTEVTLLPILPSLSYTVNF